MRNLKICHFTTQTYCGWPLKRTVIIKLVFFFTTKAYVVGTQKDRLSETVLLSTYNAWKI